MKNRLVNIIENIDKNLKINFNEIFLDRLLTEMDVLAIIIHCLKNNIDEVSETLDINYDKLSQEYISDSEVLDYFDRILLEDEDYEDDILNSYSKIVLEETIRNTRINFSFLDVRQEGLLAMIKFNNEYREKLSQNYDKKSMEYIFRKYIKRAILLYQKKELDNFSEQEFSYLLYLKINDEIKNGKNLKDLLKSLSLNEDYYLSLEKMIGDIDYDYDLEDIEYKTNLVKEKYEIAINLSKLSYIEEELLIKYISLKNLEELSKINKINKLELEKILKLSIFKLSLRFDMSIMEDLYKIVKELEIIDEKLN